MKKNPPKKTLGDLDKVISAWQANEELTINKEVTLTGLVALRKQLDGSITGVGDKKTELTGLANDRNDCAKQAAEQVTRVRSAFRGYYGPNSKQYEQAGGTRTDARKKSARTNVSKLPKAA